jgi:hypothetical protein
LVAYSVSNTLVFSGKAGQDGAEPSHEQPGPYEVRCPAKIYEPITRVDLFRCLGLRRNDCMKEESNHTGNRRAKLSLLFGVLPTERATSVGHVLNALPAVV